MDERGTGCRRWSRRAPGDHLIEFAHGDLLRADVDALVNAVNTVGVMGRGIALQFKKAFPANFKAYERAAKAGELHTGKVFVFDHGGQAKPRFIINFPTKQHWRGSAKLEYIESGLIDLVEQVRRLKITSLAVPPLGCGLGGLQWEDVFPKITAAFASLPEAHVKVFAPLDPQVAARGT